MSDPTTQQLVQLAWEVLPAADRQLLEQIGADRWEVVEEPLGVALDGRLRSAGETPPQPSQIRADNSALGMWLRELRLVLINEAHPS